MITHAVAQDLNIADLLDHPSKMDCTKIDLSGSWILGKRYVKTGKLVFKDVAPVLFEMYLHNNPAILTNGFVYNGKDLATQLPLDANVDSLTGKVQVMFNTLDCTIHISDKDVFMDQTEPRVPDLKFLTVNPLTKEGDFFVMGIYKKKNCKKLDENYFVRLVKGWRDLPPD